MSRNRGRDTGRKEQRPRSVRRILIICEDSKSSRDYFDKFPHDPDQVQIECIGAGMNTDSLMENAIERTKSARDGGAPYERVWVVFDKDDFKMANFNRAFDLARAHNEITPCWSNECFELWYLLHFHYRDTGIGRKDIWPLISDLLGKKYAKGDDSLHECLADKVDTAVRHARKLAFENRLNMTPTRNPSTLVHELVDALLKLNPKRQADEP